jgi:hypothetical protein
MAGRRCPPGARNLRMASTQGLRERVAGVTVGAGNGDDTAKGNWGDMTEQELRKTLELLKTEHRDLDAAITALTDAARANASADMLQIARLKKRKLRLKDQIAIIEDTLLPDIIA